MVLLLLFYTRNHEAGLYFIVNYIGSRTTESYISAERNIQGKTPLRYTFILAATFFLCLLLNGCVWSFSSELAPSVTGRVLDKTSKEGIVGARVTYQTNYAPYVNTAVTSEDGYFYLDSITSRHVMIILPFFFIRLPFTEYHAEKTENPACYLKIEKSGYGIFSMLLESQYIGEHRKLSLYCNHITLCRRTDPVEKAHVLPKSRQESLNRIYHNISLFTENNVLIYLQKIPEGDRE